MGKRVLICGGRDPSTQTLAAVMQWVANNCRPGDVVIHGAANGVDAQAGEAARAFTGIAEEPYPADWRAHGRAAGPIRNKRMLVEGKPDLVVAFPGGRGTANMVQQARKVGVPVIEVEVRDGQ